MAARLTDKQKKMIIADYVELGSYNAVAKRHGVSFDTVKRIVNNEPQIVKKTEQKKEENSADILAHMETKRDKVNEIIDVYLEHLLNAEMLAKATPSQLTTALGTLIDKFTMANVPNTSQKQEHASLVDAIRMRNANNETIRETSTDT